jgi:uncharacterized protein YejL (UPF0352 family)
MTKLSKEEKEELKNILNEIVELKNKIHQATLYEWDIELGNIYHKLFKLLN